MVRDRIRNYYLLFLFVTSSKSVIFRAEGIRCVPHQLVASPFSRDRSGFRLTKGSQSVKQFIPHTVICYPEDTDDGHWRPLINACRFLILSYQLHYSTRIPH
nr:PREDICTED: uncharacterized protein LOC107399268 [Tribolium castaneum]|eukprot:XP_015840870.1 PREDICTED: uncharacterized protein LOC107399268 [Tribolium castaneum]